MLTGAIRFERKKWRLAISPSISLELPGRTLTIRILLSFCSSELTGGRMMAGRYWLVFPAGLLGLAFLAGCTQQANPFVPVEGKATVNGVPLAIGHISFRPDTAKGNGTLHHPTGSFNAEGKYVLTTGGEKGAPPGWYKVLVFADENQAAGVVHPHMPKWAIAEKYTREETTDLHVEVKPQAAAGAYDLVLSK